MSSERIAAKEVARLLHGLQTSLKEQGVNPENMYVQLESDLVSALDIPPQKLFQWARQKLGLKLVILDWREKARQEYIGCLGNMSEAEKPLQCLVTSVDETEIRLGLGQGLSFDNTLSTRLPYGLGSFALENPFDIIDVSLARNDATQRLKNLCSPDLIAASQKRNAFVVRDALDELLFKLENRRRSGGLGLWRTGLDSSLWRWYLKQDGLSFLQNSHELEILSQEQAQRLVKKLILISALSDVLGLSRFRYGLENGATRAVFSELAKRQISRRAQQFGAVLAKQAQQQYENMEAVLAEIFPGENLQGRIKTQASITDKLSRKATRTKPPVYSMRDLREATGLVSDGIGFCLILNEASRKHIEQVCDRLLNALKQDKLRILELKNYRGTGPDALPYLTANDIARFRHFTEMQAEHPPLSVQTDHDALKESGYTTAQFVLLLKNLETGAFDWPPCELQIRGSLVDSFYEIEHCIRSIRLGKQNVLQDHDLPKERQELFDAAVQLTSSEFRVLQEYLNRYYVYFRRLESGLVALPPERPSALPDVFDLRRIITPPFSAEAAESGNVQLNVL